jgi:hypothetical protein
MTKTHMSAARSLQDFAPEATLNVLGSCWTKPDGAGAKFYENVLSKLPKTVGECVEWAVALEQPLKAREVQAHLKLDVHEREQVPRSGWLGLRKR